MSFGAKAPSNSTPVLAGIDISAEPTNQESTPAAYVSGQYVLPASWISPVYNQYAVGVASQGGKGGGKGGSAGGKSYNYYGTIAALWHVGQMDKLTGIIIDDRLMWHGVINRPTNGSLYTDVTVDGFGIYRHYWGTDGQTTQDPNLAAVANDQGDDHPAYTGICYGIFIKFLFGLDKTQAPSAKIRGERTPLQPFYNGIEAQNDDGQSNPFAVLAEMLTNERFGLAEPQSWFSGTTWQAAMIAAYAKRNLAFCSPFIDTATSVKSIATDMFYLCDGFLRAEAGTGLCEAGMFTAPEEINEAGLLILDSRNLIETPDFSPDTWFDVSNTFTVSFRDRDYVFKTRSIKDDDQNALEIAGDVRNEDLQRKSIVRLWQAQNYALEYKRRFAQPGNSGTIKVRSELVENIQPGHHIRTDIDAEPGGLELQQTFRVKSITRSISGAAELVLDAERTLAAVAYMPAVAPATPQTPTEIPDIGAVRFFETPWSNYAVAILASRPTQVVTDFAVYYDPSTSGSFPVVDNDAKSYALRGQLNGALASDATGPFLIDLLDVNNRDLITSDPGATAARDDTLLMVVLHIGGSGQIEADGANKAWVEIFSCSAFVVTGTNQVSVSALRARKASPARTFTNADEVWFVKASDMPVILHADFESLAGSGGYAYFKLQPSTLYAQRALADCAVRAFTFALDRDPSGQITDTQIQSVSPSKILAGIITASIRMDAADLRAAKMATNGQFYNAENPNGYFPSSSSIGGRLGVFSITPGLYQSYGVVIYGWNTGNGFALNRFGKNAMVFNINGIARFSMSGGQSCELTIIYRVNGGGWNYCSDDSLGNYNMPIAIISSTFAINLNGGDSIEFGLYFARNGVPGSLWSSIQVGWNNL